jgi:membrane-bound lytic murein transglycosylase A
LVEKRNIAVDRRYIPLGIPVFLQTKNPISKENMNILTVAADVGGAIKGKIRADYYFGSGKEAGMLAGKMKEKGTLIVFLPKGYIDAYDE